MAPSLSAVAAEFGFTDEEKDLKLGGEVSIGFFLVGGITPFIWILLEPIAWVPVVPK